MPDYKLIPNPREFFGWSQDYKGCLADTVNHRTNVAPDSGPTQDDLILAINKLMGTAPAQAKRSHIGIPFLLQAEPGMTAISPSREAYSRAYDLIQGAKLPAALDQASQTQMLLAHLRSQGIQP